MRCCVLQCFDMALPITYLNKRVGIVGLQNDRGTRQLLGCR